MLPVSINKKNHTKYQFFRAYFQATDPLHLSECQRWIFEDEAHYHSQPADNKIWGQNEPLPIVDGSSKRKSKKVLEKTYRLRFDLEKYNNYGGVFSLHNYNNRWFLQWRRDCSCRFDFQHTIRLQKYWIGSNITFQFVDHFIGLLLFFESIF